MRNIEEETDDVLSYISEMFKTPMGLKDIKTKSVSRLGEKKDEVIRPVKVALENFSMKKRVLAANKKLSGNDDYKNIFITSYLTKKQQVEDKKLRDELKERREKGETSIVIKKWKIVN